MTINVDPEWWKTLFDEVYLITDARSVDNNRITRQEIDIFLRLILLHPKDRILDLCGGHGRHSIELCGRGFENCTVFDYSQPLLDIGSRNAAQKGFNIRFMQGDARQTTLKSGTFDHVFILGNSLGYIPDPEADLHILKESGRVLKSGGGILLDVTDGDSAQAKISPTAWHQIGDDIVVCRQREVRNGFIRAREMVLSKTRGLVRDKTYGIRLYSGDALVALIRSAGFDNVQLHCDAAAIKDAEDVGCMNHRLVVTARKP